MPKKSDYKCVRCGYATGQKNHIKKHFYDLKKPCPGSENDIELTDEIKEHILLNRVYHLEKKPSIVANINNNNNNILNVIMELDNVEKITKLLNYNGQNLLGFGDQVEAQNQRKIQRMEKDSYKYGFRLEESDFLDLLDKSVQVDASKNLSQMNLLFVEELNKISLYHDDEWESYLMDAGIKKIIAILRNYYLEVYERYVLGKIFGLNSLDAYTRNKYRAQLEDLYKFYAHFDVEPYSKYKENSELVSDFSHENDLYLSEYCDELYSKVKKTLAKAEINGLKRQIITIIKKNTQVNIKSLNKSLLKLANINDEFKTSLIDEQ